MGVKNTVTPKECKKEKKYLQHHPAMEAAARLEFLADKDSLRIEPHETVLNNLSRKIDLLVIKDRSDAEVKSDLARIFERINLWEMKSAEDELSYRIYYREMSYAYQYLSEAEDELGITDTSLTFVRRRRPNDLLKWFNQHGFSVSEIEKGVIHIRKPGHPPMQIVVLRQIDPEKYKWLGMFGGEMNKEYLEKMAREWYEIHDEEGRSQIEIVVDYILENIRRDENMSEETREFLEAYKARRDLEEIIKQKDEEMRQKDDEMKQKDEEMKRKEDYIKKKDDDLKKKDERIAELEAIIAAAASTK